MDDDLSLAGLYIFSIVVFIICCWCLAVVHTFGWLKLLVGALAFIGSFVIIPSVNPN